MKRVLGLLAVLMLAASAAWAAPNAADPCGQPTGDGGYKALSAPIAISSSTATTQIAALSAGLKIYVCQWQFSLAGTNPTYTWATGTGTNCGTGSSNLTGAIAVTSGAVVSPPSFEGTALVVPAGQALCLTLGGTTPTGQGYVVYRQGP